jgi:hypothetical protein
MTLSVWFISSHLLSLPLYIYFGIYVCFIVILQLPVFVMDGGCMLIPLSTLNIGVGRNLYWHGTFSLFWCLFELHLKDCKLLKAQFNDRHANCWKLNLMIGKERQHVLSNFVCHCAHTLSWTCPPVPLLLYLKELPNSVIICKELYLWKFCLELSCGMCYLLSSYT